MGDTVSAPAPTRTIFQSAMGSIVISVLLVVNPLSTTGSVDCIMMVYYVTLVIYFSRLFAVGSEEHHKDLIKL